MMLQTDGIGLITSFSAAEPLRSGGDASSRCLVGGSSVWPSSHTKCAPQTRADHFRCHEKGEHALQAVDFFKQQAAAQLRQVMLQGTLTCANNSLPTHLTFLISTCFICSGDSSHRRLGESSRGASSLLVSSSTSPSPTPSACPPAAAAAAAAAAGCGGLAAATEAARLAPGSARQPHGRQPQCRRHRLSR